MLLTVFDVAKTCKTGFAVNLFTNPKIACILKYSMHSSTSKLLAKEMSALGIAAFHCVSVSMCETERDNEADRHREGD